MQTKTRFLIDDTIAPLSPFENKSQRLSVEWHDLTEHPPAGELLYLCYNSIIQPDVLHVKTMQSTIIENCRATYENTSPNIRKLIFERLVDAYNEYWEAMPMPDYWAIKEFPKPPVRF